MTGDFCALPRHALKNSRMLSVDFTASSYPEKLKDVFS
jgi:hypothetical protein